MPRKPKSRLSRVSAQAQAKRLARSLESLEDAELRRQKQAARQAALRAAESPSQTRQRRAEQAERQARLRASKKSEQSQVRRGLTTWATPWVTANTQYMQTCEGSIKQELNDENPIYYKDDGIFDVHEDKHNVQSLKSMEQDFDEKNDSHNEHHSGFINEYDGFEDQKNIISQEQQSEFLNHILPHSMSDSSNDSCEEMEFENNQLKCNKCGQLFQPKHAFADLSCISLTCEECNDSSLAEKDIIPCSESKRRKVLETHQFYQCAECGENFDDRELYKRHLSIERKKKRSFSCDGCGKTFNYEKYFLRHRTMYKNGALIPVMCNECGQIFKCKTDRHNHRLLTHLKFTCSECGLILKDSQSLQVHIEEHNNYPALFHCIKCDKKFSNECELNMHTCTMHCQLENFEKSIHTQDSTSGMETESNEQIKPALSEMNGKSFCSDDSQNMFVYNSDYTKQLFDKNELATSNENQTLFLESDTIVMQTQSDFVKEIEHYEYTTKETDKLITVNDESNEFISAICKPDIYVHKASKEILPSSHQRSESFDCDLCDRTFDNSSVLLSHKVIVHNIKYALLKCEKCEKPFEREHQLKLHLTEEHGERDYRYQRPVQMCSTCGIEIKSQNNCDKTKQIYDATGRLFCGPDCQKSFRYKATYSRGLPKKTFDKSEPPNSVKVEKELMELNETGTKDECLSNTDRFELQTSSSYQEPLHAAEMKDEKPDNEAFPSHTVSGNPCKEMQTEILHSCIKCKRIFKANYQTLDTNHASFLCEKCNTTNDVPIKSNPNKPYTCECGKSFTLESSLRRHQPELKCEECGESFACKTLYTKHVVWSSYKLFMKSTSSDIENLECGLCGQAFNESSALQSHIATSHNISSIFMCTKCKIPFMEKQHLELHIMKVHGDEKQMCYVCETEIKSQFRCKKTKWNMDGKSFCGPYCQDVYKATYSKDLPNRFLDISIKVECGFCGQTFHQSSTLHSDMATINGKSFCGPDCQNAFRYRATYSKQLPREFSDIPVKVENESAGLSKSENSINEIRISNTDSFESEVTDDQESPCVTEMANHKSEVTGFQLYNLTTGSCKEIKSEIQYTCLKCKKVFNKTCQSVDINLIPIYCKECGISSSQVTCNESEGRKRFICGECGKLFTTRASLNVHKPKSLLKCVKCNESFVCKTFLTKHKLSLHNTEIQTQDTPSTTSSDDHKMCATCGANVYLQCNYDTNQTVKANERAFCGETCQKAFRYKASYSRNISKPRM